MRDTDTPGAACPQDGKRWRDVLNVATPYWDATHGEGTPRARRLRLVADIADKHGLTLAEVLSDCRNQKTSWVRWTCMRAVRDVFGDSTTQIGRLFGRDHTSVMHGLRKVPTL